MANLGAADSVGQYPGQRGQHMEGTQGEKVHGRRKTRTRENDHNQARSKGPLARGSTQATRTRTQVPSARRNTRATETEGGGPGDSPRREKEREGAEKVNLVLLNKCAYRGIDPRRRHLVGQTMPCRYRPLVSASRQQLQRIDTDTPRSGV